MDNFSQRVGGIAKAIIWFFSGIAFTVITWNLIPPLIAILPTNILQGLGWATLIILWILAIFVFPIKIVLEATS